MGRSVKPMGETVPAGSRLAGTLAGRPLTSGHLAGLDGLRAVAALLVVLTHVGFLSGAVADGLLGRLLGRGDLGVGIFFGLSGFLLYRSMMGQQARTGTVSVGSYLLRRAARILPAFWLGLLVVAAVVRPDARTVAANAVVAHIYVPDVLLDGYTQTWSLATEASFYLLLPVVFHLIRGRLAPMPHRALQILGVSWGMGIVAAGVSGLVLVDGHALGGRWLPAQWSAFALGMILAEVHGASDTRLHRLAKSLAAAPGTCLALSAGAYLLATTTLAGPLTLAAVSGPQLAGKALLSSVVTAGLIVPLLFGTGRDAYTRVLSSPPARYLGGISYGVFLWHLPVFEGLYAVTGVDYFTGGAVALLAVGLPVAIGIAALSERVLERPVMTWVHGRTP